MIIFCDGFLWNLRWILWNLRWIFTLDSADSALDSTLDSALDSADSALNSTIDSADSTLDSADFALDSTHTPTIYLVRFLATISPQPPLPVDKCDLVS